MTLMRLPPVDPGTPLAVGGICWVVAFGIGLCTLGRKQPSRWAVRALVALTLALLVIAVAWVLAVLAGR